MQLELSELRNFLKDEFVKRKGFKPQYSKRAYSRDLGLNLTSLNDFLAGKRNLNLKNIDKVFKYLKKRQAICCSWCGQPKQKAKLLIGGPRSQFICIKCIEICNDILRNGRLMEL
ncbi:MAG: ClpX C4-type zinc finger protein [Pseudobdellovibrionaceae bacterium]